MTKSTHTVMQLVGAYVQEAAQSNSPAVVQALCNAVPDVVLIFSSPPPKTLQQLTQASICIPGLTPFDSCGCIVFTSQLGQAALADKVYCIAEPDVLRLPQH